MTDCSGNGGVPAWLASLAVAAAAVPVTPRLQPPQSGGRPAAVLILFGGGPDLLFVRRSATLRQHAGQPAFPGGAVDPGDGGPVAAALREAAEETGLNPDSVRIAGVMPEHYVWRSGYRVTPVLGWWHTPGPVGPGDPREIESVCRVPVAELSEPANRLMVRYPGGLAGPAFRAGGLLVWGFTAMLVDQVLALGGWERPWDASVVADLSAIQSPSGPIG